MAKINDDDEVAHSPRHCMDYLVALKRRPEGAHVSRMADMKQIKNRVNRDYLVDNGLCEFRDDRFFITKKGLAAEKKGEELR